MIKIENYEVVGWEHAIRGMRNPKNSWDRSDSEFDDYGDGYIGEKDHELAMKLAKGGPVHAKYRRMITVYVDITAPLYWWKEFDTYKVGTVANSCSTMHKIHEKEFTLGDFSHEKLTEMVIVKDNLPMCGKYASVPLNALYGVIDSLNICRQAFIETKDKKYWDMMIQLLPSSYNQKRTIMMNYEVLANIYKSRENHKLDEWRELCKWIEDLPYSEIITGENE